MYINSGIFRGRRISKNSNLTIRPSLAKVRKMVFDTLRPLIDDPENIKEILDIFAGTGAYGFECMSMYECNSTFLELDRTLCKEIRKTAEEFGVSERIKIFNGNALIMINRLKTKDLLNKGYDLVFIDPPYDKDFLIKKMLVKLLSNNLLHEESIIVVETSKYKRISFIPANYEILKEKTAASTVILMLKPKNLKLLETLMQTEEETEANEELNSIK